MLLGLVNCCIKGGLLSAHIYDKGDGKKGGDNVASLIMKELNNKNLLQSNSPDGELSIIMDKYGGQNKNNFVLGLVAFLIDAAYFKKVNFLFYIVGHTKNACNRFFNLLKLGYQ